MLSFRGGRRFRPAQSHIPASYEGGHDPKIVGLSEEGATGTNDFGFIDTEIPIDSIGEPEYRISSAITGFAASVGDYVDERVEQAFPRTQSFPYVVGKRVFDIVFSVAAIVVAFPLMLLIAIAIKLTSPGPVLFTQERVGIQGTRFKMLKFRSMYVNDRCDTHHTSVGDPRITPVGTFLRKTSLDELPQFFNVLTGKMSVVGPRPELTRFVEKFAEEIPGYMTRHMGKGGITGWAQIHGLRGSGTSIARRIDYDLEYLSNWSLWLDLKIVLLTIRRGVTKNAF